MIATIARPAWAQRQPEIHPYAASAIGKAPAVGRHAEDLQRSEVRRCGQHTDDGVRLVLNANALAENRAVTGKALRPEAFADQHDAGRTWRVLVGAEAVSQDGLDPAPRGEFA